MRLPDAKRSRIVFRVGPLPTIRVIDEFFETPPGLGIRSQQKAAPFELDAIAVLLFDAAQPNGRVEAPRSEIVGPDDEADRTHELRSPELMAATSIGLIQPELHPRDERV